MATWTISNGTNYVSFDNGYQVFEIKKQSEILMTVSEPILYFSYAIANASVPAIRISGIKSNNNVSRRKFEIDFNDVTSPVVGSAAILKTTIEGWLNTTGGAVVADGDYGDITVSGGGTAMTIDNDVVTYAKIQNVSATDKILGRSTAGAGDIEEIACTPFARTILDASTVFTAQNNLGITTLRIITGTQATTAATAQNITGLSMTLAANSFYTINGMIKVGCNNTGGVIMACTIPSGTMSLEYFGFSSTGAAHASAEATASGTLTATTRAWCTLNSAAGYVWVKGTITTGAGSGTLQFQYASVTAGQTSSVFQEGTFITVTNTA